MNPCPCGEGGAPGGCRCSPTARARYARRLSGPLVDRFDLRVEVGRPEVAELLAADGRRADRRRRGPGRRRPRPGPRARGVAANAELPRWQLDDVAPLDAPATRLRRAHAPGGPAHGPRPRPGPPGRPHGRRPVGPRRPARRLPRRRGAGPAVRAGLPRREGGVMAADRAVPSAAAGSGGPVVGASAARQEDGGSTGGPLPPEAYAAALASLPGMGPARLAAILRASRPEPAWRRVVAGHRGRTARSRDALGSRATALVGRWRCRGGRDRPRSGVARADGRPGRGRGARLAGYPPALADDVEPPAVLFHRGAPEIITGPRVAIVGTRRCSVTGRGIAYELGRDLAAAGVAVVSGLASGIDGAAHQGALAAGGAPPIGVVGTRPRRRLPARPDRAVAGRGRGRGAAVRGAARVPARALAVPGPQPHHRRPAPTWSSWSSRTGGAGRCTRSTRPTAGAST